MCAVSLTVDVVGALSVCGPSTASSTLTSVSVLSADPLVEAAGERVSSLDDPVPVVTVVASEEDRCIAGGRRERRELPLWPWEHDEVDEEDERTSSCAGGKCHVTYT